MYCQLNNLTEPCNWCISPWFLQCVSFSVTLSAWLGSSTHGCWAAGCSLLEMENSWEAAPEIRLSAARHIEWSDLLPFLTKNVHNHDDKREPNLWSCSLEFTPQFGVTTKFFTSLNSYNKLSSLHWAQKDVFFPGPWKGTQVSLCFSAGFPFGHPLPSRREEWTGGACSYPVFVYDRERVGRLTTHSFLRGGSWEFAVPTSKCAFALTLTVCVSRPLGLLQRCRFAKACHSPLNTGLVTFKNSS